MNLKLCLIIALFQAMTAAEPDNLAFNFYTNYSSGSIVGYNNAVPKAEPILRSHQTTKLGGTYKADENESADEVRRKETPGNNINMLNNSGTLNIVSGKQSNYYYFSKRLEHDGEAFKSNDFKGVQKTREETTDQTNSETDSI